jgi:hypothetical protein
LPRACPSWIESPHPKEIFRLEAPELEGEAKFYEAHRHRTGGGGRLDVLEFGSSNGKAPMLHLVISGQASPSYRNRRWVALSTGLALPPRPNTLAVPGFSPRMTRSALQAAQIKRQGKGR